MAMLPFCGYHMGDYFAHWLRVGSQLSRPPKMFFVNWFQKNNEGTFIWPGFRDNSRVIKWMVDRIKGKVTARETAVGLMPYLNDLFMDGLSLSPETIDRLFRIDKGEWQNEIAETELFYAQFGNRLPVSLQNRLTELKEKIEKC